MKLKPTKKGVQCFIDQQNDSTKETPKNTERKTENKRKQNTLPKDEYNPMFPPKRFLIRETASNKDKTKMIKQFMEVSVKRYNDDEGLPFVWVQMYQESDFYTGYLAGKSVYLPLEMLYDLIDNLNDTSEECDKRHIE